MRIPVKLSTEDVIKKVEEDDVPQFVKDIVREQNISDREKFFRPEYTDLHDPFLLQGAKKTAERLLLAIKKNESILIYADYDADGIPAGVLVAEFLEHAGHDNYQIVIPDRHFDGFGFKYSVVEKFIENANLIITVDCGIADYKEFKKIPEHIDCIVIDHHEPPIESNEEKLPDVYTVVDTKCKDETYPYKELCGCGIAFKIVQACRKLQSDCVSEEQEKLLLDLVAIATLSDMVPLVDENRMLVQFGMKILSMTPRVGLRTLLSKNYCNVSDVTPTDVAFTIAPRINAASRVGNTDSVINLLRSGKKHMYDAENAVAELEKMNNKRKKFAKELSSTLKDKSIGQEDDLKEVICVGNKKWRPAMLGPVASQLSSDTGAAVFLWGNDGNKNPKGSCRSVSHDVTSLLRSCSEHLTHFGGHTYAGGFSIKPGREDDFAKLLEDVIRDKQHVSDNQSSQKIYDVVPRDITSTLLAWQNVNH